MKGIGICVANMMKVSSLEGSKGMCLRIGEKGMGIKGSGVRIIWG